ncbi:MAG TPA: hypothetical protein VK699_14665 [Terriglobales bacterium]|jgi:hypothetical protein|nr:hypothetical protein [Terriglobales bacterium]
MTQNRAILCCLFAALWASSAFAAECTAHKQNHKTGFTSTLVGVGCTEAEAKNSIANALGRQADQEREPQCEKCTGCPKGETCTQSIDPKDWDKFSKMIQVQPMLTDDKAWRERCHSTTYFKATLSPPNPPESYTTQCSCEGPPPK